MDKCRRNNGRSTAAALVVGEDSLLPPTRRVANYAASPVVKSSAKDKRSSKQWSIDGLFRKLSSILDAQSSSSSLEELSGRHRPRHGGKSKDNVSKSPGYAFKSREGIDYSLAAIYRNNNNNNNNNNDSDSEDQLNANMSQSLDALEARLTGNSAYSRSSDGSLEGGGTRRLRKDKVKARVEAKRDQLCVGDSSMDESSTEEPLGNVLVPKAENSSSKRRSRASRTERYLKRMCNGACNVSIKPLPSIGADHRLLLIEQVGKTDIFQPIDRAPKSRSITLDHEEISLVNDPPKENLYAPQSDIGVNPLVQQTLQYFSEFDRHMATNHQQQQQQQRMRKTYPAQQHHRRGTLKSQVRPDSSHTLDDEVTPSSSMAPPKPPSRDHTSRVLINGTPMDKYQQMLRCVQMPPSESQFSNAGSYAGTSLPKHKSEVRNANNNSAEHECPPKSPLRESLNMTTVGVTKSLIERNQSPLLDLNQSKYRSQPSSPQDYHNLNYVPHNKLVDTMEKQPIDRRSSKNLEEALCELEAIYNSLQLGDEELLERAEKRTMEEFHYKGFTASPDLHGNEDSPSRRKACADQTSGNYKEEAEIPDRLKDDMAYRRMHPKERPPSTDGQSSLSSISYLMTSPIPSRREMRYIDTKRKSRRKEPDVALDDVVFRSMQYANNTLKVVEPQPPFGIPLGPITAATESDYLHTNPTKSERSRSPYIPSCEPDLVTDDLAFRNLRKDAQPSSNSRQPSPSLLHGSITGSSNCTSPLSFGLKKKRAVRSLSANLYGLINKPKSPLDLGTGNQISMEDDSIFDDFFDDIPVKHITRRTSDPELMCPNWQKNTWDKSSVNRNKSKEEEEQRISQRQATNCLDVDLSDGSCDESSDERISPQDRLKLAQRDSEHKAAGSDVGSSYLSSNCSTPPPILARSAEPFTEQEISVYKKLCQDLENLVQLTKGIDGISTCGESAVITLSSIPSSDVIVIQKKSSVSDIEKMTAEDTLATKNSSKSNIEQITEDSVEVINIDCEAQTETSPVKQKISMILDNLKSLREDSNTIDTSISDEDNKEKDEESENPLTDDKSFKAITKEICDLVARADVNKHELSMKVKEKKSEVHRSKEDDENKDRVDNNLFFRNVQLAKLSGDWKESTPNNNDSRDAVIASDRRTSLTGGDSSSNWEGMTKCNHKYNSMPAKTSSLLPFRHGSKRKSSNRKSMCTVS